MTKAEKCIVMAKGICDDSIIHNAMSMNELPPLSMSSLRISKKTQNQVFWSSLVESKLQSIYSIVQVLKGMPYKNDVLQSTRESTIQWDPEYMMTQYEHQSNDLHEEQKVALKVNVQHINKYTTTTGHASQTYAKILLHMDLLVLENLLLDK